MNEKNYCNRFAYAEPSSYEPLFSLSFVKNRKDLLSDEIIGTEHKSK